MEKEKEKLDRATHEIQVDGDLGQVQIADEVVAIIAGMAATEVKGVASMAGNIKNELVAKMGMKNLSRGVKVGAVTMPTVLLYTGIGCLYPGANIPISSSSCFNFIYCRYRSPSPSSMISFA